MAGRISEYPSSITTLESGDLFDVSEFLNPGYESKKLDWDDLLTNLNSQLTFANIYTTDGTTTGQRTIGIGTNDLIFGSTGDANLLRFDATSDRLGIGTAAPLKKLDVVGGSIISTNTILEGLILNEYSGTLPNALTFAQGGTANTIGATKFQLGVSNGNGQFMTGTVQGDAAIESSQKIFISAGGTTATMVLDNSTQNVGIGTSTPTEKLEVVGNALIQQGSFSYGGTTIESRVANNRGNILAFTNAGGVSFNDYGNLAGAAQGLQDFKSHFANYRLASTKNSSGYTDQTFLHLDTNQSNSAPSVKAGINTINSSTYTVLDVGINKNGPVNTNAQPIAVNVADNFGTWNEDFAGIDKVKTGFKSSMTDTFTSSTTGSGIVRSFWANAQGGDRNDAIFVENGLIVSPNMPTSSAGLPTGALWNNGGVINIV